MCLFSTNSALYSTCMYGKIHLKSYVIVLHFLSFYLFFILLFYFINTQNCLLKNVSFGYTLYRTIHRNFAHVIFNIVKQKWIIWRTRSKLIQWSKRQWQSVPRKLQENLLPSAFSWEAILENTIHIAECLFQTSMFCKTSPLEVLCHQWNGLELEFYGGHHL